jgi:predicted nucleotidyltransferase
MSTRKVPESVARLTEEFVSQMRGLYGDRLDKVILFGSYARGDQREDSDVDYLVVLNDEEIRTFKEISNLSPITFELSLQYGIAVSAIPVLKSSLEQSWSPLYHNVLNDGILI